ncbi:MAG: tRNA uridine(34) 5-carboxymethylaminomethyl modification radical SAM/GNAT enzyme Elp3 [Nanoarchaeota archaeon]|jgi:elongator complex protein 3|nr:tRNA uridine(34) 5-carboxymethylaminomethyl modification radical SAM/GNAT enzyme Elp3 [Nanoarchaeota archaeon]|tara:strand:- start:6339 stop:7871 length:1533 start_codon:yes stop_codon:yes gene_type:complete
MDIEKYKIKLAKEKKLRKIPKTIDLNLIEGRGLVSKPSRTIAGVAPVAIMTEPRDCPHGSCIYCPGGVKSAFGSVPKSYTGNEPATMRAKRNKYNAYLQVFNRLEHYILLQQIPEKVELIIMGGTFLAYPRKYQEEFVIEAFKAMNDFSRLFFVNGKLNLEKFKEFFEFGLDFKSEERTKKLLKKISALKKESNLEKEQKKNEKAKIKCVALVLETRPDWCFEKEIKQALKLGVTRMELGVQHLDNEVLKEVGRGHTVEDIVKATRLLKEAGLKVVYHIMPGLKGSSMERDVEIFKELFSDPRFKPDGLKIYPCMVMKGTKLYDYFKKGKFNPITTKQAIKVISAGKKFIPEYCRVYRIQRDIPSKYITSGVDVTNLRQYIEVKCRCIRCREPRGREINWAKVGLVKKEYEASKGREIFLSYEYENYLLGFLRLRLDKNACVREMHVYGEATKIGEKGKIQHRGLGKRLLRKAEEIAKGKKLKIISGVGVRDYFRSLGYKKEGYYMTKKL